MVHGATFVMASTKVNQFLPVTKFYTSLTNIDKNMGTSLKDAESSQVLIFLSSSPYVHPWWPDKLSR
jgi:hypothetical protein